VTEPKMCHVGCGASHPGVGETPEAPVPLLKRRGLEENPRKVAKRKARLKKGATP